MATVSVLVLLVGLMPPPALSGTVQSADQKPIASAVVIVQQNGRTMTAVTDDAGAFSLPDVSLPVTIEVQAAGFTTVRQPVTSSPVIVTLATSSIRESVIVSAPAPVELWRRPTTGTSVLTADFLEKLPAVTLDEGVRVIAGVSLFRRSSSRASNPTTHGVTMRGLSASGASRGLVVLDGVPLNDGFGGWVTWSRLPALAASYVAVDRGAEGTTFGSDALGGVIQVVAKTGTRPVTEIAVSAGTESLGTVDAATGGNSGRVAWFGTAGWYRNDGVIPVAPESRGPVDTPANAEWSNVFGRVSFGDRSNRVTVSGWGGQDDRGNGTVLQRNHINGGTVATAYDGLLGSTNLAGRLSVSPNDYMQTFSFVAPGRATETLTSTQFVNTTTTRGIFEAGHTIPRGYVTGRVMVTRAPADFTEQRSTGTTTMDLRDDGESVSVHAGWSPVLPVTIGAGIRGEWRAAPDPAASDRDSATVGYVSGAWQASETVVVRGSAATSHRWPTLNELVRNFQVGNVLTQANPDLLPERARSADAAVAVTGAQWSASATGFWTVVEDAVTNVTIQSTPTIIRQRRNAANAEALGLELDGEVRLWGVATIRASAVFVDSRFHDSVEPALEGNQLPQVPPASFSLSGDVRIRPWLQVASVYRYLGPQFDDDRNVFELARASQVDLRVFGDIKAFTWFVTVENAADARIEVGRTPLVTLAPGRAARFGVTWRR